MTKTPIQLTDASRPPAKRMSSIAYSSLAAFLAHYRALKCASSPDANDTEHLARLSALVDILSPDERAALESDAVDSVTRRHRQRAELKLRRELIARAIVAG